MSLCCITLTSQGPHLLIFAGFTSSKVVQLSMRSSTASLYLQNLLPGSFYSIQEIWCESLLMNYYLKAPVCLNIILRQIFYIFPEKMEDEDKVGVLIEFGLEAPKTAKKVNFLSLISVHLSAQKSINEYFFINGREWKGRIGGKNGWGGWLDVF